MTSSLFRLGWMMAMALVMVAVHFGALAIWPVYRFRNRGRARLQSLSVTFVVHVVVVAAWTLFMATKHRDHAWLNWLSMSYIALNVAFAIVYFALYSRGGPSATRAAPPLDPAPPPPPRST
jgi:hypothetical protein